MNIIVQTGKRLQRDLDSLAVTELDVLRETIMVLKLQKSLY